MENIGFTIEDVLDLAIGMEDNGVAFYTAAHEISDDPKVKAMFSGLTNMERSHKAKLSELKKRMVGFDDQKNSHVDEAVSDYLLTWVDAEVFKKKQNPKHEIVDSGHVTDILKMAITLENESIAFYSGLRDYVANNEAEDIISFIIKEEFSHVARLNESLKVYF